MLQFGDPLNSKLQDEPEEQDAPNIALPAPAGFKGEHMLAVQVLVNFWGGRVTGVVPNVGGKFHRLEVVRMISLDKYDEDADAWMRVRVGKRVDDVSMRPDMRTSLILPKAPAYGLKNMKPWFTSVSYIEAGIHWAVEEARKHKTNQYALVLAIATGAFQYKEPKEAKYEAYMEAEVRGLFQAEVLKLDDNPGLSPFDPVEMTANEDDTNYGRDY